MTSQFIFTTCQVGAEPALKKEISKNHPSLRFAFSRPGFLTFKSNVPLNLDFELNSIFTRAYGLSITKAALIDAPAAIREVEATLRQGISPVHLHIWERDQHKPGEEPKGFEATAWTDAVANHLKRKSSEPAPGDLVLDLIAVEADQLWIGAHRHSASHSIYPGSKPSIELPENAPSRAYLKVEEAIRWSHAPIQFGDCAVEIGSAPGGASYALLQRGVNVVGIDPAEMDQKVLEFGTKRFIHIQQTIATVRREDLPEQVDWLLLDMNVSPQITLFQVDRLVSRMQNCLLGVMLTVKLNEWSIADQIPDMLAHLKAMGMTRVRATQLPSNKQELFIYGLTRKGLTRKKTTKA
jgi:23S rRNA (cytidine2498-2'-O)-methyltransferase